MINAFNLKKIGENAFNNCINLTNILIPKQTKLENDVFKFCINLKIVFIENKNLFNSISGKFLKDNKHIKTISDDNSYFSCCNKNLRLYDGYYYLQKNKEFKNDKIINITNEKTFDNTDLCKNDSYINLLTRDGYLNNHIAGFKEYNSEILYIVFAPRKKIEIWSNSRRYTSYKSNLLYFFDIESNWYMDKKNEILKMINVILRIKKI